MAIPILLIILACSGESTKNLHLLAAENSFQGKPTVELSSLGEVRRYTMEKDGNRWAIAIEQELGSFSHLSIEADELQVYSGLIDSSDRSQSLYLYEYRGEHGLHRAEQHPSLPSLQWLWGICIAGVFFSMLRGRR